MTVYFSLAVAISLLAGTDVQQEPWIGRLLKSKTAQTALLTYDKLSSPSRHLAPPHEVKLPNGSSFIVLDPTVGPVYERASKKVSLLLAQDLYMDAYTYISDVRREFPQADEALLDLSIECELLASRYADAFRDSVVRVKAGGFGGEEQELYLSLSSAALGLVYPGQAKFCEKWATEHLANQGSNYRIGPTSKELDPHEVMILSSLALGLKDSPGFLELALRLDPINEIAARQVIFYYSCKGRYSDLSRIASNMMEHLPAGEARDYYVEQIALVANRKDRPQQPVINP